MSNKFAQFITGLRANYRDNKVMLENDKNTIQVAQIVTALCGDAGDGKSLP